MLIRLKVEKSLSDGHFKEVYRNTVVYSDSINFPFEDVIRVMNLLYPKHIVNFSISEL